MFIISLILLKAYRILQPLQMAKVKSDDVDATGWRAAGEKPLGQRRQVPFCRSDQPELFMCGDACCRPAVRGVGACSHFSKYQSIAVPEYQINLSARAGELPG